MTDPHQLDPAVLGDHIDRLYRAAWGLCGSHEEAEDLVQETFAQVLRRPRLLQSDDEIGYLLRVLRNTFISGLRRSARRPAQTELPDELQIPSNDPSGDPEASLRNGQLYAAVAALPGDFRDAVVAVDLVGLSYRDAARALRVREATLTTRVHRGRRRLAQLLSDGQQP